MSDLEKFIRDHAEMFDDQEPSANHLERFEQRLNKLHATSAKSTLTLVWMKIAAGIVILLTAGLAIFDLATHDFSVQTNLQQAALSLPDELVKVLDIYERRSDQQLTELNRLAQNCPNGTNLVQSTKDEVAQLDQNMNELVSALKENPSDSRVQNALIKNCKAKESLLSDRILQEKMRKCN
ncbi:MAG: hypothetical protein JXA23_12110 [Bacteroidales bacterium]|nr:hypothetical protein [Bacteroidales bacterium]